MPISFVPKVNKRVIGEELAITDEQHIVPSIAPFEIKLTEVPLQENPSTVSLTLDFVPATETNTNIFAGEFRVDYTSGKITLDSSAAGQTARVTYKGRGSIVAAEDINELQLPLAAVFNEVETARGSQPDLDTRLDVSLKDTGLLQDLSVTPNTISTTPTDDFVFPNDVTVAGDLTVSGTTTTVNNEIVNNSETITIDLTVNGNSNLGDANTDTTTIKGSLVIDATDGSQVQFNQKQAKQIVIEVLSSDPGSPVEGQIWYNNVTKQWKGYNGSINVILG